VRDKPSERLAGGAGNAGRIGLCLDFANTVDWHASDRPQETLHAYADLLGWAQAQAVVTARQAELLARRLRREPQAAAAVYRRATALREAVYRIFVARIAAAAPAQADAKVFNEELRHALAQYHVQFGRGRATWRLAEEDAEFDSPLWPIVQSAAALLLREDLHGRVGQCADPAGCGWLFIDISKNRSRRWCSIRDCGNRAKQRRLQARRKRSRETMY
jgi:predicted RNA-binding Zn ribbon-like protein